MSKRFTFLFLFFFSSVLWGNTATLILEPGRTELYKGDTFEGRIEIHPVAEGQRSEFYSLSGKEIEDKIKILQVKKIVPNANNLDVLEVQGLFVVLNSFDLQKPLLLKAVSREAPLRIRVDKVNDSQVLGQELQIIKQPEVSLPWPTTVKWMIGLTLFVIAILFYEFRRKKLIERRKVEERKREFAKWNELFMQASSRRDYEKIYAEKDNWLKLIEVQTPPIVEFKRVMQEHQFKEEWNKTTEQDVRFTFDNIKGIFQ